MNSEEIKVEPLKEDKEKFKQLKAFVFQNTQPKTPEDSGTTSPKNHTQQQQSPPKPPGLGTKPTNPIQPHPILNLPYDFTNFQKKDIEAFDFTSKQKLLEYIYAQPSED